jgi:hypothetical protein
MPPAVECTGTIKNGLIMSRITSVLILFTSYLMVQGKLLNSLKKIRLGLYNLNAKWGNN